MNFTPWVAREVRGGFDGGAITSDGGGLLLREVEKRTGIVERFAACFRDHREAERVEHTVRELVAQRVYGLALGYEDLNDHDELRRDPLLAVLVEKEDPTGESRARERDRGKALAGKSTLNRLELTKAKVEEKERYKKIVMDARGGGPAAGGGLSGVLRGSAAGDGSRSGRHGRSAVWAPGRAVLSRLLRGLLLSAAVYLLRPRRCCVRACGRRISMRQRGAWRNWNGS